MVIYAALGHPPRWLWAVYFVSVMFIAGYYAWRADHLRLMPKLRVSEFFILKTPNMTNTGRPSGESVWIQILPKPITDAPVSDCQGHLLRVRCLNRNTGKWETTAFNEPLPLGWSMAGHLPRTLHPGVDQRLNIFWVWSMEPKQFKPCVEIMPLRAVNIFDPKDRFRFDVRITAKDTEPLDVTLEAAYTDEWDKPELKLLSSGQAAS